MGRGRPAKCIYCGSARSIRKGVRRTKGLGERRIRLCKDCGRKFTPRHQKVISECETLPGPENDREASSAMQPPDEHHASPEPQPADDLRISAEPQRKGEGDGPQGEHDTSFEPQPSDAVDASDQP